MRTIALMLVLSLVAKTAAASDWPMWRCDAARTARAPDPLPENLQLQWVRKYPPLRAAFWQVRQERVQFDLGYEPIVCGQTMFVPSSCNDSLTALDTATGQERWRFYAEGPLRLAAAAGQGKVYAASDDGRLYCLDAATGRALWSVRGAPSPRRVLGNGRLISAWPARGAPVLAGDTVYFAAGVWPFEGIFITALDAATGRRRWVNDRTGSLYIPHPHGGMSFGGPSPQGYLLVQGDELAVPSSRAFPAWFQRGSGELASFDFGFGGHGSVPGGWFLASDAQGRPCVDSEINTEIHDVGKQVIGQRGIRRQKGEVLQESITVGQKSYQICAGLRETISAGGREYRFAQFQDRVSDKIHTMLAADGKLFIVTRQGSIHCFGPQHVEPQIHEFRNEPLPQADDAWTAAVKSLLAGTRCGQGYAIVLGLGSGRLAEELLRQSDLHVVVVDRDPPAIDALRRRMDRAGLYGSRIAAVLGDPRELEVPPNIASLVAAEEAEAVRLLADDPVAMEKIGRLVHPYGGVLALAIAADRQDVRRQLETLGAGALHFQPPAGPLAVAIRTAAPPGVADYTGEENADAAIRMPVGVAWFGDTEHHHKLFYKSYSMESGRGLPTNIQVVDGVLKYTVTTTPYGPNPVGISYQQYMAQLQTQMTYVDAYTDIYTGRLLPPDQAKLHWRELTASAATVVPPPSASVRRNPVTGLDENREFQKTHGCDQRAVDYGQMLTMRSATAAFYDKQLESGTVNISGLRSGCRNSIVPAGGMLLLPSWTGNCTCNYPLTTSLGLVSMPPEFEQWTAWGGVAVEGPVRRVGINFGAPGDRMEADGTLWLGCPNLHWPSTDVPVRIEPASSAAAGQAGYEPFYRHALWVHGELPWVTASGIRGMRSITIQPVALRSDPPGVGYSMRWSGSLEPGTSETYVLSVVAATPVRLWLDDKLLLDNARSLRRGEPAETSAEVPLVAGQRYKLAVEHVRKDPATAPAAVELAWRSPTIRREVIPGNRLRGADGQRGGLTGVYYDNGTWSGPGMLRSDAQVHFEFPRDLPFAAKRLPRPIRLSPRTFTVGLYFADPEPLAPGQRVFSVKIQGHEILKDLDIVREAGGADRGIVRRVSGIRAGDNLQLEFVPATARPPLICGVKLVEE
jgi:hypothetical protein